MSKCVFFQVYCCAFTASEQKWVYPSAGCLPEFLLSCVCVIKSGEKHALLRNSFGIWHGIPWGREMENEST